MPKQLEQAMYKIQILMIVVLFIIGGGMGRSAEEAGTEYSVKGMERIDDEGLKSSVLKYLQLDEDLDYLNLYGCLSKKYLAEQFPDIETAGQYDLERKAFSEISSVKYLEMISVKYVDTKTVRIGVISESVSEGVRTKTKVLYVFVNEENAWKYDGMDFASLEMLPE